MNIRLIDAGKVSYLRSQTIYHALAYAKKPETPDTIVLDTPGEPYVCIGFFKDLEQEVDVDFCEANDIPIIRRETGGGTVYLDDGQLFTQWIFEPERLPVKTDHRFQFFIKPLVETYQFFGIKALFQPPNDVHVRFKKIVGTGAARIGNAEVVTGNFLFDFDCERMAKVLKVPGENFRQLALESLQKYMTSMKQELATAPDREEVKQVYVKKCAEALGRKIVPGDFTDEEYRVMEELDKKFVTKEWLYQYKSNHQGTRLMKIHANVWLHEILHETQSGQVRLIIRTKGNRIDRVFIDTEFETLPVHRLNGLEQLLRNVEITETALTEIVEVFYELHQVESPRISIQDWVAAVLKCKM